MSRRLPQWLYRLLEEIGDRFVEDEKILHHHLESSLVTYSGSAISTKELHFTMAVVRDSDTPGTLVLTLDDSSSVQTSADTPPVWSSDNTAVVTITAAADGMSATPAFVGVGTANISVQVTDSSGQTANIPALQFTVEAGEAVTGTIAYVPPSTSTTATSTTTSTTADVTTATNSADPTAS